MFWIVDSIIMRKKDFTYKKKESPPRRKHKQHKQKVYLPLANLERTNNNNDDTKITVEEHSLIMNNSDNDSEQDIRTV